MSRSGDPPTAAPVAPGAGVLGVPRPSGAADRCGAAAAAAAVAGVGVGETEGSSRAFNRAIWASRRAIEASSAAPSGSRAAPEPAAWSAAASIRRRGEDDADAGCRATTDGVAVAPTTVTADAGDSSRPWPRPRGGAVPPSGSGPDSAAARLRGAGDALLLVYRGGGGGGGGGGGAPTALAPTGGRAMVVEAAASGRADTARCDVEPVRAAAAPARATASALTSRRTPTG